MTKFHCSTCKMRKSPIWKGTFRLWPTVITFTIKINIVTVTQIGKKKPLSLMLTKENLSENNDHDFTTNNVVQSVSWI